MVSLGIVGERGGKSEKFKFDKLKAAGSDCPIFDANLVKVLPKTIPRKTIFTRCSKKYNFIARKSKSKAFSF